MKPHSCHAPTTALALSYRVNKMLIATNHDLLLKKVVSNDECKEVAHEWHLQLMESTCYRFVAAPSCALKGCVAKDRAHMCQNAARRNEVNPRRAGNTRDY